MVEVNLQKLPHSYRSEKMNSLVRLSVGFSLLTLLLGCATKPKDDGLSGTIEQNASASTFSLITVASKEKIKGGNPKQGANSVHSGGVENKKDAADASGAGEPQLVGTNATVSTPPVSENPSSPDHAQKEVEPRSTGSSNLDKQEDQVSDNQVSIPSQGKTVEELPLKDVETEEPPASEVEDEPVGIAGSEIGEKPSIAKLPSPEQIKNDPESPPDALEEQGNPGAENSPLGRDSDHQDSDPGIDSFFESTSPRDVVANTDSAAEGIKPSIVTRGSEPGNPVDSPSREREGGEVSIFSGKPELIPSGVSVSKAQNGIGLGLGFADPLVSQENSGKSLAFSPQGIEPALPVPGQSDDMRLSLRPNHGRSLGLGLLAGKGIGFSEPGEPDGLSKVNQRDLGVGFVDSSSRRTDSSVEHGMNLGFSDKRGKARIPRPPLVRANQIQLAKTRSSNGRDYAFLAELFDFEGADENPIPRSKSSSPDFSVIQELFSSVDTGVESPSPVLDAVQAREGDRYEPVIEWLRLSGLIENAGE
jgi:hypothetical protein